MQIDKKAIQDRLRKCDFTGVFTQELGWDFPPGNLTLTVAGKQVHLQAVAEKKGLVAYVCPSQAGERLPDYAARRKIEREVAKHRHQHLIVFTDAGKSTQVWQWVKRELGKPAACREHTYQVGQPGDSLIQKLTALAVSLQEEESLTHVDVTGRVKKAFDVEKVTKRFYDRFQREHQAFLMLLKGIPDGDMQRWYVSVMLNRLMFIYFIQWKGFLGDADRDYLRTKLVESKLRGKDRYYREFLCPLFFEGFAKRRPERSAKMNDLLGTVPYLNGGLFLKHQIEELHGEEIRIPDAAFEKLFEFFQDYHWHLDERPLKADNEINPDVLGYIFEKYINQKQMGAYYTKEDITEYIAKNTIIPFLFDATAKKCPADFAADAPVWRLLREDPDRYIYPAVRRGVVNNEGNVLPESALPDFVRTGMNDPKARMFDRRYNLGEADLRLPSLSGRGAGGEGRDGGEKLTLPTETWREYVCRRQRCLELREKLGKGEVATIDDLITLNLDIRQFAQDAIANCQSPELLAAFFDSVRTVAVLDPTCGSGAFLFAALNILEPLYEACLDRMESFLSPLSPGEGQGVRAFRPSAKQRVLDDFRQTLKSVNDDHPNAKYFIFKSIIIRNLFGVDIMEEATEICKLRLFLKLVAQVDPEPSKPNLGVEPLPDIDFNIRAGNTLVGYTTIDEIRRSHQARYPGFPLTEVQKLEVQAKATAELYSLFCRLQTNGSKGESTPEELANAKNSLRREQQRLADELDRYLAGEYGIDTDDAKKAKEYEKWRTSHQPFHWFVEFYGIMTTGGFDVVIGNPPWVEYAKVKKQYMLRGFRTEASGNLHAICTERGLVIRNLWGRMSFIVQLPLVSSSRMTTARNVLRECSGLLHVIPCDDRPGKLFEGLEHCRATIWLSKGTDGKPHPTPTLLTTRYQRWPTECRPYLFEQLEYASAAGKLIHPDYFPKYSGNLQAVLFTKIAERGTVTIGTLVSNRETEHFIFYQEATQYWVKATVGLPYYAKNGKVGGPAHGRYLFFANEGLAHRVCAILNSSLFYAYFVAYGDCFHLSDTLVTTFPIMLEMVADTQLPILGQRLMAELREGAERKTIQTKDGYKISYDEYFGWKSKDTIDKIDCLLAKHYGLTDEELDIAVTFDIKHRLGQDDEGDGRE